MSGVSWSHMIKVLGTYTVQIRHSTVMHRVERSVDALWLWAKANQLNHEITQTTSHFPIEFLSMVARVQASARLWQNGNDFGCSTRMGWFPCKERPFFKPSLFGCMINFQNIATAIVKSHLLLELPWLVHYLDGFKSKPWVSWDQSSQSLKTNVFKYFKAQSISSKIFKFHMFEHHKQNLSPMRHQNVWRWLIGGAAAGDSPTPCWLRKSSKITSTYMQCMYIYIYISISVQRCSKYQCIYSRWQIWFSFLTLFEHVQNLSSISVYRWVNRDPYDGFTLCTTKMARIFWPLLI